MFSVLAAGNCSGGSNPLAAVTHNASELSATPAPVTSSGTRRSTASAIAPPHNPNTTSGTSPNKPVRPTQDEDPVSWWICVGTATTERCAPITVTSPASQSRR